MPAPNSDLLAAFREGADRTTPDEPSVTYAPFAVGRLVLEELDGTVHAVPYQAVMYMHFDAGVGITIAFPEWAFEICGIRLAPLFEGLLSKTVERVKAVDLDGAEQAKGPVVDKIKVQMTVSRQVVEKFSGH